MRKRNGVVLFVTMMMILLLMSIVSIFLNKTKESKDKVTTVFAMTQTNAIMYNLLGYINELKLDEYAIFFASQTMIPLNLGDSNVFFKLNSNQRLININSLLNASIKDNIVSDKFIYFLLKYKIEDPDLFLNLLKDTIDKDRNSRASVESEIVMLHPTFRNGKIYNRAHLDMIVDYYFEQSGDGAIYNIEFDEFFSYTNNSIDLNFISLELMEFLFEDLNHYTISQIDENEGVYDDIEDMPFDPYYRKKIEKGMMGQRFTTKTETIDIEITLVYMSQFESKIRFKYNIKSKKIFDYEIMKIVLQ